MPITFLKRDPSGDNAALIEDALAAAALDPDIVEVWLSQRGVWPISRAVRIPSNVRLLIKPGVRVAASAGAADGFVMFETVPDRIMVRSGLICDGGVIDMGTKAAVGVRLHSTQNSRFDLEFDGNRVDSIALDMLAESSSSTDSIYGSRNTVTNKIERLIHVGVCGDILRMWGGAPGGSAALGAYGAVTINQIDMVRAAFLKSRGIHFKSWCDSNTFAGQVCLRLQANDAVGVYHDDQDLAGTVYDEVFQHLIVSPYGAFTGRKAVYYGAQTKMNAVHALYIDGDMSAEGGNVDAHPGAASYDIAVMGFAGTDGNTLRNINKTRLAHSMSFQSSLEPITMADDSSISFKLGANRTKSTLVVTVGTPGASCIVTVNPGGGLAPIVKSANSTLVNTYATALFGTTGADGKLNIGVDATSVWIENRLTAQYKINISQLATI